MYWNYRVLKEEVDFMGELHSQHKIISVYYDENHKINGWADTSETSLVWEELDDLEGTLDLLKEAFKRPLLKKEKGDELVEIEST